MGDFDEKKGDSLTPSEEFGDVSGSESAALTHTQVSVTSPNHEKGYGVNLDTAAHE
jgi:hypothetical protein